MKEMIKLHQKLIREEISIAIRLCLGEGYNSKYREFLKMDEERKGD